MNTPFDLIPLLFPYLLHHCDYPLSPCDLGVKILIGRDGLCKTSNSINNHVIP